MSHLVRVFGKKEKKISDFLNYLLLMTYAKYASRHGGQQKDGIPGAAVKVIL
jgi:hypothetical protein